MNEYNEKVTISKINTREFYVSVKQMRVKSYFPTGRGINNKSLI